MKTVVLWSEVASRLVCPQISQINPYFALRAVASQLYILFGRITTLGPWPRKSVLIWEICGQLFFIGFWVLPTGRQVFGLTRLGI